MLLFFAGQTMFAAVPTVKAVPANRVTYTGASLNVLVNPSNDSTTISFEYGLTASYGSTINITGKYNGNNCSIVANYNFILKMLILKKMTL